MNNFAGVYEIRNKLNGHRYIGGSVDIGGRWRSHKSALRKGTHHSTYLQRAWNKYGAKNFLFNALVICDPENTTMFEQRLLDGLKPEYNISTDVTSPHIGRKLSKEHRAKISASLVGNKRALGYRHDEETRARISSSWTGKKLSDKTRRKISELRMGDNNPFFGKHHSEEARRKISEANMGENNFFYGKHHSEETKAKISKSLKEYYKGLEE